MMTREDEDAKRGFTLIELLIVVAIIAILAGIALPNFLEAQTRSKVARVKADMRTIAGALEAYHTDNGKYPPSFMVPLFPRLMKLTTPVSYISSVPKDEFNITIDPHHAVYAITGNFYYCGMPIDEEKRWTLTSDGPDRNPNHTNVEFYPGYSEDLWENSTSGFFLVRYDPTNGTISEGDIWRTSDHIFP